MLSEREHQTSLPRHRWFVLKEAFSASFVDSVFEREMGQNAPAVVLDPFCGCGTTLLTAAGMGIVSVGIEVNPFMAFAARVKTSNGCPRVFARLLPEIREGIREGAVSPLEGFSTFSEGNARKKWLFNTEVLRAFEGAWKVAAEQESNESRMVRLCLIVAAMDVCNAFPDGKCLRYRRDWKGRAFDASSFLRAFEARAQAVVDDLQKIPELASTPHVLQGDAREVLSGDEMPSKFNLCVTSPPYLNSFDYSDIYRPHMFLGRFVNSNDDLRAIRKLTLRSHVQTTWDLPSPGPFPPVVRDAIEKIEERKSSLWDPRIPDMVRAYFEDWRQLLSNLHRLVQPGGALWIVISSSAYAGVEIPVDIGLAELAELDGWEAEEVVKLRPLRASGHHWMRYSKGSGVKPKLRESAVVLRRLSRNEA